VRIDQNTDFPALVARTLGGSAPEARWARKLWYGLAGTGLEDEVARAAGACLRSTDPLVRASALRFFDSTGQVPGSEVIEEVAAACDVDPLDAVPDPTYASGVTLGRSVRIGLSRRIAWAAGGDPDRALAIAKRLILQPGRARELLSRVSGSDWPWFERHADEIVKANPKVCEELLEAFRHDPEDSAELATRMAVRLALLPGTDKAGLLVLRSWAERWLSGDALAAVRAALTRGKPPR
jgi:hypothetical protein